MKNLSSSRLDRALRLELLRAHAAIQRENFTDHIEQLSVETNPMNLLGSMINFRRKNWLRSTADFLAQYPSLVATLSTYLMGKSSRVARGSGLVLVLLQTMLAQQSRKPPSGF